jgi:hypothetical protein
VTNNDAAAKLIVIKHVINDNGGHGIGASFTMGRHGDQPEPVVLPGRGSPGTQVTLKQGTYTSASRSLGLRASYSTDCTGSITSARRRPAP